MHGNKHKKSSQPNFAAMVKNGIFLLVACATVKTAWDILAFCRMEFASAYSMDARAFFGVARGWLNGLTFYTDLYETKPPGIFLLSALSLRLTGDDLLTHCLYAAGMIFTPVIVLLTVRHANRNKHPIFALTAAVLCGQLLLYANEIDYRPEPYAVFLLIAYACLLYATNNKQLSLINIIVVSLLLLGAIGLMEPFALVSFSIAILLCRSHQSFLTGFVMPMVIAAILGVILLMATGALDEYLFVHLPIMRALDQTEESALLRIFLLHKPLLSLKEHSVFLVLAIAAICVFAAVEPYAAQGRKKQCMALAGITSFVLCGFITYKLMFLLRKKAAFWLLISPDFWLKIAAIILLADICIFANIALRKSVKERSCENILFPFNRVVSAVLCAMYAVGSPGPAFSFRHLLFLLPVYVSIFFALLNFQNGSENRSRGNMILCIAALLSLSAFFSSPQIRTDLMANALTQERKDIEAAKIIDDLLNNCNLDRYLHLGHVLAYGYTQHSPYGPALYAGAVRPSLRSPILSDIYVENVHKARLIVINPSRVFFPSVLETEMEQHFSQKPWRCAEGFVAPPPYVFFFRKEDDSKALPHTQFWI